MDGVSGRRGWFTGLPAVLVILAVGYALVAACLGLVLKFDFLQSDVYGYWQESLDWGMTLHSYHVPGYPFLIALVHTLTGRILPPIAVLMLINFTALLVSALLVYRIIEHSTLPRSGAAVGALAFGLWPFVGLVYSAYPLADIPAKTFLLAGIYFWIQTNPRGLSLLAAAGMLGISMVMHKAMWPVVLLLVLSQVVFKPVRLTLDRTAAVIALAAPLGITWFMGFRQYSDPLWLLTSNLETEIISKTGLPVLDGLVGALSEGGARGLLKGGIVAGLAIVSVLLLIGSLRGRGSQRFLSGALSLAVLALFLVLNQYEIWAAVRFSRLLVLPLLWAVSDWAGARPPFWARVHWIAFALGLSFLTQFVYAWYIARVFFMNPT
jgi:hypothetical protein